MEPIDKSNLLLSLNNNDSCSISKQAISKRIIFTEKGLLSQNKEILILLTDVCFEYESDNEVYAHIVKYEESLWCSFLVYTHVRLNKEQKQEEFLIEYYKKIIITGHWSPMNSVSEDDVFIESNSFNDAVQNLNQLIKNFSKDKHIPVSPDPIDEINGTAIIQEGNCDFRLLNIYKINLACSQ